LNERWRNLSKQDGKPTEPTSEFSSFPLSHVSASSDDQPLSNRWEAYCREWVHLQIVESLKSQIDRNERTNLDYSITISLTSCSVSCRSTYTKLRTCPFERITSQLRVRNESIPAGSMPSPFFPLTQHAISRILLLDRSDCCRQSTRSNYTLSLQHLVGSLHSLIRIPTSST